MNEPIPLCLGLLVVVVVFFLGVIAGALTRAGRL